MTVKESSASEATAPTYAPYRFFKLTREKRPGTALVRPNSRLLHCRASLGRIKEGIQEGQNTSEAWPNIAMMSKILEHENWLANLSSHSGSSIRLPQKAQCNIIGMLVTLGWPRCA